MLAWCCSPPSALLLRPSPSLFLSLPSIQDAAAARSSVWHLDLVSNQLSEVTQGWGRTVRSGWFVCACTGFQGMRGPIAQVCVLRCGVVGRVTASSEQCGVVGLDSSRACCCQQQGGPMGPWKCLLLDCLVSKGQYLADVVCLMSLKIFLIQMLLQFLKSN